MYVLRKSTASQEVLLGQFVDDTDGKTAETALSIGNTDVKLHKAGATTQANKNSGGATHIASGYYYIVLDATDTNTVGTLRIDVAKTGALPVSVVCVVLPETVYDLLFGGYDTTIQGTAQGGTSTTITLASGESAVDDHVSGRWAEIVGGTGAGQTGRFITDYVGSTKVATVDPAWATTPDATSVYRIYNGPAAPAAVANMPSVNVEGVGGAAQDIALETTLTNIKGGSWDSGTDTLEDIRNAITTVDNELAVVDANVDAVLVDTGTTLPATLTTIEGKVDTVDTVADAIKAKTDNLPASPAATGDIPVATAVADAILGRNIAGGSSTGRTVTEALERLRNRVAVSGGTMTVYETDDTTASWTAAVTTAAGDPVSEVDPA